jgi:hypothetical protein
MVRFSALHSATAILPALLLAAALNAQTDDQSSAPRPVSKVRIVRLSQVKGEVQMDRAMGRGLEPAIANLPIVEGSRLETGNGVAEIEFEDNSTLRVTGDSVVEFPKLDRLPGGTTESAVRLVKGMAYVSLMKSPGSEFNLLFGEQSVRLAASSHVRLEVGEKQAKLAVLEGTVTIEGPSGVTEVARKNTATFALPGSGQPTIAKNIGAGPYDAWDHNAADYHARSAMTAFGNSPYAFGTDDMSYYGSFVDAPGCGSMWRPYFASAAWYPYSTGAWAWYQGAGYSWVSSYPWGWTPYHYGTWAFCPDMGWGWTPGGAWTGLNNVASVTGPNSPGHLPTAPPRPPRVGEATVTPVGKDSAISSEVSSAGNFVFRKDSAGLGVPREGLGKLARFSQHALEKGAATTPVYFEASESVDARGRSASELVGAATMHRGTPPPADDSLSSQGASSSGTARSTTPSSSSSTTSSAVHSGSSGGGHH